MKKIISFEGSDYSGKTSTAKYLVNALSQKGFKVRYNCGTIYKKPIQNLLYEIAKTCDDSQKEILYTMCYLTDNQNNGKNSEKNFIIQDRFWMSVLAYGRFLNNEKSLNYFNDLRSRFTLPSLVIRLTCSLDEKIKRSANRKNHSSLDKTILSSPEELSRLEKEIDWSLEGLKVVPIDTSNITIPEVAEITENYLKKEGLI